MPFTFLAHQAPVLPLKRWKPELDGVALVVGSCVPDLARATMYAPWPPYFHGRPLWFDGHTLGQQFSWCLPVGLVLTWTARRWVLPRLADYLPDLGPFHLRDLRLVDRNRHRWWMIVLCILIGSVSHVIIDIFTHSDRRWVLPGMGVHLFDAGGRSIEVANVVQVVATVLLAAIAVWQMWLIGRDREVCRWSGVEPDAPPPRPRRTAVRVAVVAAALLTGIASLSQWHRGPTVTFFTWVLVGWGALCVIAAVVGRPTTADVPAPRATVPPWAG